jgi:hypothetical protein
MKKTLSICITPLVKQIPAQCPETEFFIQVRSLIRIISGHGVQQYIHMEGDRGNTL